MRLSMLFAVLVLSFDAVYGAEAHTTVPSQFLGFWVSSEEGCRIGGESELHIYEDRINFYEGGGRILGVATEGQRELALIIEATGIVEATGERSTWLDLRKFELSADGNELTDVTINGRHPITRLRCPAPE
jgi:hypothetical protein